MLLLGLLSLPGSHAVEFFFAHTKYGSKIIVWKMLLFRGWVNTVWATSLQFVEWEGRLWVKSLTSVFLLHIFLSLSLGLNDCLLIWIWHQPRGSDLILPLWEAALEEEWLRCWFNWNILNILWFSSILTSIYVFLDLFGNIGLLSLVWLSTNPHVHGVEEIKNHHIMDVQVILLEVGNLLHVEVTTCIGAGEKSWLETWSNV